VGVGLCGPVWHFPGYVPQVDRASGVTPDHDLIQILEIRKENPRLHLELAIAPRETPGLAAAIRVLELCHDRGRREPVCCKPLRIEHDSYLPRFASDDVSLRNAIERLK